MSDTTELMAIEDAMKRFRKLKPCMEKYPYPLCMTITIDVRSVENNDPTWDGGLDKLAQVLIHIPTLFMNIDKWEYFLISWSSKAVRYRRFENVNGTFVL